MIKPGIPCLCYLFLWAGLQGGTWVGQVKQKGNQPSVDECLVF